MRIMFRWITAAGLLLAGACVAVPAQAAAGGTPAVISASPAFLRSGAPKTVVLSPRTGVILSVRAGAAQPLITQHDTCNGTWACYESGSVPYPNVGFSGTAGTKKGTWQYREEFSTENYHASACWTYAGSSHCTPEGGPGTVFTFNGELVTGTSATLYSS